MSSTERTVEERLYEIEQKIEAIESALKELADLFKKASQYDD